MFRVVHSNASYQAITVSETRITVFVFFVYFEFNERRGEKIFAVAVDNSFIPETGALINRS